VRLLVPFPQEEGCRQAHARPQGPRWETSGDVVRPYVGDSGETVATITRG